MRCVHRWDGKRNAPYRTGNKPVYYWFKMEKRVINPYQKKRLPEFSKAPMFDVFLSQYRIGQLQFVSL